MALNPHPKPSEGPTSLQTMRGREPLTVHYLPPKSQPDKPPRASETIEVLQLPISIILEGTFIRALSDDRRLIALYTGKSRQWAGTLTPTSAEAILALGKRLNYLYFGFLDNPSADPLPDALQPDQPPAADLGELLAKLCCHLGKFPYELDLSRLTLSQLILMGETINHAQLTDHYHHLIAHIYTRAAAYSKSSRNQLNRYIDSIRTSLKLSASSQKTSDPRYFAQFAQQAGVPRQ